MKKKSSIKLVLVLLITSVLFLAGLLVALKLTHVINITWMGIISPFLFLLFILVIVGVSLLVASVLNNLIVE